MAREPKNTAPSAGYDPAASYDVAMAKVVDLGVMKLRPAHAYVLTGEVLSSLPTEAILSATPVPRAD